MITKKIISGLGFLTLLFLHPATTYAQDAVYDSNLRNCLSPYSGLLGAPCNHSILRPDDLQRVRQTEYQQNLQTCTSSPNSPTCRKSALTPEDMARVEEEEYRRKRTLCTMEMPFLTAGCDVSSLRPEDQEQARRVQYTNNFKQCLNYASVEQFCNLSLLGDDDLRIIQQVAYQKKLTECLSERATKACDSISFSPEDQKLVQDVRARLAISTSSSTAFGDISAPSPINRAQPVSVLPPSTALNLGVVSAPLTSPLPLSKPTTTSPPIYDPDAALSLTQPQPLLGASAIYSPPTLTLPTLSGAPALPLSELRPAPSTTTPLYPSTGSYTGGGSGSVYVRGYVRKDGTYVRPHTRSRPRR